jgi:aromatic-L-amino-acid decarboxylase
MEHDPGSPLSLDAERMRRLGYRTVDMLVERLAGDPGAVVRSAPPEQLLERLARPAPAGPSSFDDLLDQLERDVLPYVARISHPGYLAFVPGEGTWPGALGDFISSALNVDTCWWLGASGPAALELVVLDWIREWIGYPRDARGVLTSGGSASNLTAMACAREALLGPMDASAIAYLSDQAHASLAKGARALGFRPDQVRVLASDSAGRLRVDALQAAVGAPPRRAGGRGLWLDTPPPPARPPADP